MTDALPTMWEAEPHTLVKHRILRRYPQAWLPILTRQAENLRRQSGGPKHEVLFIDGFAGPGRYMGGEPGSPVIALEAALDHASPFPMPARMLFIEQRADRFAQLQREIAPYVERAQNSPNLCSIDGREGDCDSVLNEMLNEYDRRQIRFGPAFAFLDQFGYGEVSMDLVRRILSYPQCEVFTYLSYKEMNRWISDPNKTDAFNRAFGGPEWQACVSMPADQRRMELLQLYKAALRTRAGARYVVSFLMFDKNALPLYWLLFCTQNLRGLEEMKKAMWHVDDKGEFRFSDRDNPDQLDLLKKCFDQNWLAGEIRSRLAGRVMNASEVKEYVLVNTPCYLFKAALKSLESSKAATVIAQPIGRKPLTFPDDALTTIRISFERDLLG